MTDSAATSELHSLSAAELAPLLKGREISPVEVLRSVLARRDATEPQVHAFVSTTDEVALAEARQAESEISSGSYRGPLHGIPLAVKDNIAVRDTVTAAGAQFLAGNVTGEDAHAVQRLREAGAIVIGKTNLHELAFGSTTINPHFGTTANPWRLDSIVGGSSGGSAAAVVAGHAPLALGTDHAGSIRIPASLCNVVGLKPTHGLVSVRGLVGSRNVTADHVGPITRTVRDAAAMLDVVAGYDARDPLSIDRPPAGYVAALEGEGLDGKRVGVPANFYFDLIDPEVETLVRAAIGQLESLGADLVEVRVPDLDQMVAVRVALGAEGLAFADPYLRTVPDQFSDHLRRTLLALYFVPARDLARGNRVRRLMHEQFAAIFREVDLLATPSTCVAAFPITARTVGSLDRRTGDTVDVPADRSLIRATWPSNLTGLPALSVPAGFTEAGLPVGLQLTGRAFSETSLLAAAYAFEQATKWFNRRPPLS